MVRISAIFIAVCMVLIAGSIGFVVYLRFGLTGAESFLVGLGVLTALAVYNAVAARSRDRAEVSDQIASISRSSSDWARQLAEFGRQLGTVETKVDSVLDKVEQYKHRVKKDRIAALVNWRRTSNVVGYGASSSKEDQGGAEATSERKPAARAGRR